MLKKEAAIEAAFLLFSLGVFSQPLCIAQLTGL